MRWTLDEVRQLDVHECDELVAWLRESAQTDEEGAIDMDAVTDAKLAGMQPSEDEWHGDR